MKTNKPEDTFDIAISKAVSFSEPVQLFAKTKLYVNRAEYSTSEPLRYFSYDSSTQFNDRESRWLDYIERIKFDSGTLIPNVNCFFEAIPNELLDEHCSALLDKLKKRIALYLEEIDEDSEEVKRYPSQESLLQLFRYIYEIPTDSDLYIDHDSGFFGVNIKEQKDRLAFTIKDNKEIVYSLVSIGSGVSKFSGRGFISKSKDSWKIKRIIGMVKDV